ncbi:MAG: hypothetical protein AB1806_04670 [Acidobacteriota bacterium]
MEHRHLTHTAWTLAAVDDAIARGRMDDWKALRLAAVRDPGVRDRILRVCAAHLADPTEQRFYFWDYYVRHHVA